MSGKTDTRPWIEKSRALGYHECAGDTPATPEAAQWDGYKTALKPAAEEWILVRKPISERNVARNVLQHGTGGLNVDACRVPIGETDPQFRQGGVSGDIPFSGVQKTTNYIPQKPHPDSPRHNAAGRYPPHVVFSHAPDCTDAACVEGCPVAELGEQSGVSVSSGGDGSGWRKGAMWGSSDNIIKQSPHGLGLGDTGTAARFFPCFRYQPKPPPSERAGSTHPTQKSLALMEWLVKLITAPDQTVLDCFMGSGTTGVAALRAGRQFVGIEMNATYFAIAQQRITEERNRPRQLDMFGEE
jgi:site-specific DNA-methyltransferase (adenine-specific)